MEGIEKSLYRIGALKDIILLRVSGYIDTTTSPDLQKTLAEQINQGNNQFIIDLGGVHYVSSAGWGIFVGEIRGLREKGGDLKITQMTPDVYEVFEMLEFNRILTSYDSLEEAIDDFDYCRGLKFTSPHNGALTEIQESDSTPTEDEIEAIAARRHEKGIAVPKSASFSKRKLAIEEADLPVTEKIKKIVIENPMGGVMSICKELKSQRFGFTKIGYFKLRATLKKMNLESKAKRYRFYRSR
ncbi:MAG TPA: STAS domain-containing protein [bacterium]|nr:STAS domain-containing protein [bacterium]HPN44890.1 STAS domain-containing protein [bacterium]